MGRSLVQGQSGYTIETVSKNMEEEEGKKKIDKRAGRQDGYGTQAPK